MEAVAKYAYTANSASELSFNVGDTMKVSARLTIAFGQSNLSAFYTVFRSFRMTSFGVVAASTAKMATCPSLTSLRSPIRKHLYTTFGKQFPGFNLSFSCFAFQLV